MYSNFICRPPIAAIERQRTNQGWSVPITVGPDFFNIFNTLDNCDNYPKVLIYKNLQAGGSSINKFRVICHNPIFPNLIKNIFIRLIVNGMTESLQFYRSQNNPKLDIEVDQKKFSYKLIKNRFLSSKPIKESTKPFIHELELTIEGLNNTYKYSSKVLLLSQCALPLENSNSRYSKDFKNLLKNISTSGFESKFSHTFAHRSPINSELPPVFLSPREITKHSFEIKNTPLHLYSGTRIPTATLLLDEKFEPSDRVPQDYIDEDEDIGFAIAPESSDPIQLPTDNLHFEPVYFDRFPSLNSIFPCNLNSSEHPLPSIDIDTNRYFDKFPSISPAPSLKRKDICSDDDRATKKVKQELL